MHFEDDDNSGDQDKEIRDIGEVESKMTMTWNQVLTKNTNILFKFYRPSLET